MQLLNRHEAISIALLKEEAKVNQAQQPEKRSEVKQEVAAKREAKVLEAKIKEAEEEVQKSQAKLAGFDNPLEKTDEKQVRLESEEKKLEDQIQKALQECAN